MKLDFGNTISNSSKLSGEKRRTIGISIVYREREKRGIIRRLLPYPPKTLVMAGKFE
jgi:hypothetical protein